MSFLERPEEAARRTVASRAFSARFNALRSPECLTGYYLVRLPVPQGACLQDPGFGAIERMMPPGMAALIVGVAEQRVQCVWINLADRGPSGAGWSSTFDWVKSALDIERPAACQDRPHYTGGPEEFQKTSLFFPDDGRDLPADIDWCRVGDVRMTGSVPAYFLHLHARLVPERFFFFHGCQTIPLDAFWSGIKRNVWLPVAGLNPELVFDTHFMDRRGEMLEHAGITAEWRFVPPKPPVLPC